VDLQRKIDDLQRVIDAIKLKQGTVGPDNWVKNCPCNPTRGGSGVCSCIMGGTKVIY
jgi:alkyl hydroperoxide reductase subunit AhpC